MSDLEPLQRLLEQSSDPDNPDPAAVRDVLESARTVAVVGMSRDPTKAARRVPSYLAAKGYEIVPVNPHADRILGREALEGLDQVKEPVDMILVFRPPEEAAAIVEEAAARPEEPVIWLQEGIRADEAARAARSEGRTVIQDLCSYKAHRALGLG